MMIYFAICRYLHEADGIAAIGEATGFFSTSHKPFLLIVDDGKEHDLLRWNASIIDCKHFSETSFSTVSYSVSPG